LGVEDVTPDSFSRVPVLTKKVLRETFPAGMVSLSALGSKRPIERKTSGSTGIPLKTYYDADLLDFDRGVRIWHLSQTGLERGDRTIFFFNRERPSSLSTRAWHLVTGPRYIPPAYTLARDGRAIAAFRAKGWTRRRRTWYGRSTAPRCSAATV